MPADIHVYIESVDIGFAPNPYGELLTLTCCKPSIRTKAKVGDLIVAMAGKNLLGSTEQNSVDTAKLVYIAKISEIHTWDQYEATCKKNENLGVKIPILSFEQQAEGRLVKYNEQKPESIVGDCLLDTEHQTIRMYPHAVDAGIKEVMQDLKAPYVLCCEKFAYFGDQKKALCYVTDNAELKDQIKNLIRFTFCGSGTTDTQLVGTSTHRTIPAGKSVKLSKAYDPSGVAQSVTVIDGDLLLDLTGGKYGFGCIGAPSTSYIDKVKTIKAPLVDEDRLKQLYKGSNFYMIEVDNRDQINKGEQWPCLVYVSSEESIFMCGYNDSGEYRQINLELNLDKFQTIQGTSFESTGNIFFGALSSNLMNLIEKKDFSNCLGWVYNKSKFEESLRVRSIFENKDDTVGVMLANVPVDSQAQRLFEDQFGKNTGDKKRARK